MEKKAEDSQQQPAAISIRDAFKQEKHKHSLLQSALVNMDYDSIRKYTGIKKRNPSKLLIQLGKIAADPEFCKTHGIAREEAFEVWNYCVYHMISEFPSTHIEELIKLRSNFEEEINSFKF